MDPLVSQIDIQSEGISEDIRIDDISLQVKQFKNYVRIIIKALETERERFHGQNFQ